MFYLKKSPFESHIEDVLKNEWMGTEVQRKYGHTALGQEYVFVITKVRVL